VVNYFDSQRFGSLKHGQGFIAKDLIRGDFEAALKNYLAKPSPLDRTDDAKVKRFWSEHWGDWGRRVPYGGAERYERIIHSLREAPADFKRAFLQIDSGYRALQLFAYQSYLWNEGVRRLLQLSLSREHLFPMPYQAGTLLFHRDADPETLRFLREASFPLLSPHTQLPEGKIREAALWALGKDKLTLEQLRVPGAERLLYFKDEPRPVLVYPQKMVVGRASPDELNPGSQKINVAFTLPPGSYATLVIRRLFHFSPEEQQRAAPPAPSPAAPPPSPVQPPAPAQPEVSTPRPARKGFRAQQREKKQARQVARSGANALKSGASSRDRGRPPPR
jgi:tRNA pseudouridine13 synthase